MNTLRIFLLFAISPLILLAQAPSTASLRQCAEEKGIPPKDYVFKLFEKSDIVVLGERDHRDTVQYNFILDLLADPRFAEQIGHVYTEVGSINMTEDVNRLLQGTYPSEAAFNDSLYAYYRKTEIFYPLWEKYNRVKFLRGLYHINQKSPRKIRLGLTDCRFSWDSIRTPEDYRRFWNSRSLQYRDSLMCAHFAEMYERQTPLNGKRKALIITSQPHAISHSVYFKKWGQKVGTEGWWIKQTFGEEQVKIVLLNWFDYVLFNGQNYPMTGEGHWDAAFEQLNCRPFGLDLKGTPYGQTIFNGETGGIITLIGENTWQDVADGLIYDAPLYDHVAAWGIEGLMTPEFTKEMMRRIAIYLKAVTPQSPMLTQEEAVKEYGTLQTMPATFKSREEVRQLIQDIANKR